ncbi:MAG: glutamate synthase subunit beta [Actinomycetota bacterium]|nr:glutamate synthase subunit beta [Actinomycetota bacterium]
MADPKGFLTTQRELPSRRPVDVRIMDWREVYEPFGEESLAKQAGRCMDCGIPFCHNGCPLGNLIPEWNDLVWEGDWHEAAERLHATNNFPEFTGRLCPAPCETACVLGINADPVTIKQVEVSIIDRAWDEGWVGSQVPDRLTGKTVAVVGSGPAGLAAAQQLARAGHTVAVFERSDRIGGLLRYGIPEFKMEKRHLDRRIAQMEAEGVKFRTGIEVGIDEAGSDLRGRYDAVVVAIGATAWRDLPVPGRDLAGIYQAMEYLPLANRVQQGDLEASPIDVSGAHVVIIGGGDTGADCLGTAHRQGAASVTQLEILPTPPATRPDAQPWPTYPMTYRVSSAHEEGGDRLFAVSTERFVDDGNGRVAGLQLVEVEPHDGGLRPKAGTQTQIPADFVFLAMGFVGPEPGGVVDQLGLDLDPRGAIVRDPGYRSGVDGVFVAGDAGRGQSLIVWAIAEGRSAAAAVDAYLMGGTNLPAPIPATARPLLV